jgi:hypothetical protein
MNVEANVSQDGGLLTVSVPLQFVRRGGRKLVLTPEGQSAPVPDRSRIDSTLVKAIARAHRWQRMLEGGDYASIAELAVAERINSSYLARVLRLTLLAPDIVESILQGCEEPQAISLPKLMKGFPVQWQAQRGCRERLQSASERSGTASC